MLIMQFLNVNNLILMKYRVIAQRTDAGLFSLEFDTRQTNLKIFKTVWSKMIAVAIILLNIVLITTSLFDIAE